MWFVYFQEFERKRKKQNRLVIGVYNLESGEKRKIFVRQKVRVPTRFLSREQADDLESRVKSDDLLSKCIFEKPDFEDYKHRACSIVIPYDEAYL